MEELSLTVAEAVLGCRVVGSLPDGRELDLRIPPETRTGTLFRVAPGRGPDTAGTPDEVLLRTRVVTPAQIGRGPTLRATGKLTTRAVGSDGVEPRGVVGLAVPRGAREWAAEAAAELLERWAENRRPALLADLHPGLGALDAVHGPGGGAGIVQVDRGEASLADVAIRSESGRYAYLPLGDLDELDALDDPGDVGATEEPGDLPQRLLDSGAVRVLTGAVRREGGLLILVLPEEGAREAAASGLLDAVLQVGEGPAAADPIDARPLIRIPPPMETPGITGEEKEPSESEQNSSGSGRYEASGGIRAGTILRPPSQRRSTSLRAQFKQAGQIVLTALLLIAFVGGVVGVCWLLLFAGPGQDPLSGLGSEVGPSVSTLAGATIPLESSFRDRLPVG